MKAAIHAAARHRFHRNHSDSYSVSATKTEIGFRGTNLAGVVFMRGEFNQLLWEVARLGAGSETAEDLAARLSPEERAVFEIGLIETMTRGTREQKRRLRSALIKCGYDEQCAQRARKEPVADRVRASMLLSLIHPEMQKNADERSIAAARSK